MKKGIIFLFLLTFFGHAKADAESRKSRAPNEFEGWLLAVPSATFDWYLKANSFVDSKDAKGRTTHTMIMKSVDDKPDDSYLGKASVREEDCQKNYGTVHYSSLNENDKGADTGFAFGDTTVTSALAKDICEWADYDKRDKAKASAKTNK